MSLAGCQINPIMSMFIVKKVWKFLIQIQLTKSNPTIASEVKVPCLMPIRVKRYAGISASKTVLQNPQNIHKFPKLFIARTK